MNNNSGIKILLVILIVVCLFQSCGLADLSDQVDNLNNQLNQMDNRIDNIEYDLDDIEDALDADGIQMSAAYEVASIDWNTGKIYVDFAIDMYNATNSTRLMIGNGNERVELTKSGSSFTGTVEYPIDDAEYPTVVYQYEGDYEVKNEHIDWISAGILMSKNVICEFDGLSSYGNGRLTLAGDVVYGLNIQENITSAKLVFGEEEITLENTLKGEVNVNLSQAVEVDTAIETSEKFFYVEMVTETGFIYRIYPQIFAHPIYQVEVDESMEHKIAADQEYHMTVTTPEGTTYEMILY